jgi:hypothetical protein
VSASPAMRRVVLIAAIAALLGLALVAGIAASGDPGVRLDRALAAMERVEALRFELVARVEATGAGVAPVTTDARMIGEFQSPDRLHVSIVSGPARRELVIIGKQQWVDDGGGYHTTVVVPEGPLRDAKAPLRFIRGGGAASFAGLGLSGGAATYRVRLALSAGDLAERVFGGDSVPPDARGVIEVEIGLLDDLIRRQTVEITTGADAFYSGHDRVRTTYRVDYWDHGRVQEVREPE